jgi:hypothetical protein
MNVTNLSAAQLRRAADLAERIEALNAELSGLLGGVGGAAPVSAGAVNGGRRTMSAAGRARIAAAARARWARAKAQGRSTLVTTGNSVGKGGKAKRTMSASARAKIAAAARARWAKLKASK